MSRLQESGGAFWSAYSQGRVSVTLQSQVGHGGSVDDDHARASSDRRLGISPQEGAIPIQGHRQERECEPVKTTYGIIVTY